MQPDETRHDRGLATMRKMFGPGIDSALKSLEAESPGLARSLVEFPFADTLHIPNAGGDSKGLERTVGKQLDGHPDVNQF
jgi:hypothetical protein